jgi:hypothetical protein
MSRIVFGLALAASVASGPAWARPRRLASTSGVAAGASRAPTPAHLTSVRSPCGRHRFEVVRGAVRVNGRVVTNGVAQIVGAPVWRPDGRAVAWIERAGPQVRLVVLPEIPSEALRRPAPPAEPLPHVLGEVLRDERLFWAGQTRVVLGRRLLEPRAVLSWTESEG